jgi:hypothetical protein
MSEPSFDFEKGTHTHIVFLWDSYDCKFETLFFKGADAAKQHLQERLDGNRDAGHPIEPKEARNCFIAEITHKVSVSAAINELP